MKRNILIGGVITAFALSGCEKLEREINTEFTEQIVTESYINSGYRQAALYTYLPEGFLQVDRAMLASATDEAEHTEESSAIQRYNNGSWNPLDVPDNAWSRYYAAIRGINAFLASMGNIFLDNYKYETNPTYDAKVLEVKRWGYEARFLRAYYYFELIKRYGGVPIFTTAQNIDSDFKDVQRNTLQECINFITAECDSAAKELPPSYADAGLLGRITRGAALGLKSRVLLYAASDLFSDPSWAGGYSNPELISVTGDRMARWKAAADAAKLVIDMGYTLHTNYRGLFNTNNSPEIILVRRNGESNEFEKSNFPSGYDFGEGNTTPSQNLVDAYEMADGTAFNWNNPAHAADPYSGRDPRLTASVITNNTWWYNRMVELWTGGRDGKGIQRASKTGYYLKKYLNEGTDLLQNRVTTHSWIYMRLGEIYLNYAEALNEYSPGHADIAKYVNFVRQRTGVNMPPLPTGLTQQQMRERIRHERMVELAFEDFRAWDVRRWMKGPEYFGAPLRGVNITRNTDGSFNYAPIVVEQRVFEPKMYLYPIPQGDLSISPKMVQNPLW